MLGSATNPTGSKQFESDDRDGKNWQKSDKQPGRKSKSTELSLDTSFEILKNQRRRYVLEYLRESSGTIELNALAKQLAAWENNKDTSLVSSKEYKRVYVSLYQSHLIKMDDSGIIEFDQNRGTIELLPAAEQLYAYLDLESDPDNRPLSTLFCWFSGVMIGGVAFGLAGLVVTAASLGLLSFVFTTVFTVAVVGLIVGSSARTDDDSLGPVFAYLAAGRDS